MTIMAQPDQFLLQTEIGGSIKFLVGITNPLMTHTENQTDPTIQPTIVHPNQTTGPVQSDRYHYPLGILKSSTDVPRSGWNIDNRTVMNTQGPTVTTLPESNNAINGNIFTSFRSTSYLSFIIYMWHGKAKNESEKLGGNKSFENAERENNFEVEKVGHQNSLIWHHKDSISIHVDKDHTD